MDEDNNLTDIVARCYHDGKFEYLSSDDGRHYCSLSDEDCPYYKRVNNHEYCTRYVHVIRDT